MITTSTQLNELYKKKSILQYGSQTNGKRVKCGIGSFGSLASSSAGTSDYNVRPYSTYRTHPFSGYLIPESHDGHFAWLASTANLSLMASGTFQVSYNNTGARQTIVRRRFILPTQHWGSGKTVGNFRFYTDAYNSSTTTGSIYSAATSVGTAGTLTITVNFGTIALDGTKTQISTANQQYTLAAMASGYIATPISVTSSTFGNVADGDALYIEVVEDLNQTARTSGTGTISISYATGTLLSATAQNQTWFDFYIK